MIPTLDGIDHVHVFVSDREAASDWYASTLGLEVVSELASWATPDGPLTMRDQTDTVHIALFQSDKSPSSTIAFKTDGDGFLAWQKHLTDKGLELRISDHQMTYSMYFSDPDGNSHEITTWDHEQVREQLSS